MQSDTEINAILIETDESAMASGTMKFYVDQVECPETNGVGVDAKGGVFNCGLTGTTFEVKCTDACTPSMKIVEISLWTDKVMTINGTPHYVGDAEVCPFYQTDLEKLFGIGSYWFGATIDNN